MSPGAPPVAGSCATVARLQRATAASKEIPDFIMQFIRLLHGYL
jgi:hypothetical protein